VPLALVVGSKPGGVGNDTPQLVLDADLVAAYTALERLQLDSTLHRAIVGTHLEDYEGVWLAC
jgi:hypothetical protein